MTADGVTQSDDDNSPVPRECPMTASIPRKGVGADFLFGAAMAKTEQLIAWGARVAPEFRSYVRAISARLGINPDWLMACMSFETGRTFSPTIRNAAGSGAIGLIQFMPSTAAALGTSVEALAAMSAVQQLVMVEAYFRPNKGRLHSLGDVYMAILWPGGIGKADEFRLFSQHDAKHPKRYLQNRGLDWNEDGYITKAEACAGPARELRLGLMGANPA